MGSEGCFLVSLRPIFASHWVHGGEERGGRVASEGGRGGWVMQQRIGKIGGMSLVEETCDRKKTEGAGERVVKEAAETGETIIRIQWSLGAENRCE